MATSSKVGNPRPLHFSAAAIGRRGWLSIVMLTLSAALLSGSGKPCVAAGIIAGDEIWMVSTRHLETAACAANLQDPRFAVQRYDGSSRFTCTTLDDLLGSIRANPDTINVIYVHGNRFTESAAVNRARFVYCKISQNRMTGQSMRLIIWSWPSEQEGILLKDVRTKAERTDAQGLYLAWLLREMGDSSSDLKLIGYSFGGRVVTGSLHALAGGALGGRRLPGPHTRGLSTGVGLLAPAIDRDWLLACEYHGLATKNMERLSLMYNPRDSVLRRYWLLDPLNLARALGAVARIGPMRFGTRIDGSRLPVVAVDCSRTVGRRHDELDYFSAECEAGRVMATMIENR